jgi:hypothetical protein
MCDVVKRNHYTYMYIHVQHTTDMSTEFN